MMIYCIQTQDIIEKIKKVMHCIKIIEFTNLRLKASLDWGGLLFLIKISVKGAYYGYKRKRTR